MPESEMTATSVVPPPMSTTMLPEGSVMGRPAPMAAAVAWSTRYTSEALAFKAESFTARFSTWVTSDGMPMMMRGRTMVFRLCAFRMKWESIFSVISKSAMTPSFMRRAAEHLLGVLADGLHLPRHLVHRHDGGLGDHDALALGIAEGIRGPQVDG